MPAHGQKSTASSNIWDNNRSSWCSPHLFYSRYPELRPHPAAPAAPTCAPGPCPTPAPLMAPTSAWESPEAKREAYAVAYGAPGKIETPDPVAAAEEALREARQQAKENAAAERAALAAKEAADAQAATKHALRDRLMYEEGLANATGILICDVRDLLLNGRGEPRACGAYAKYASELQPLAKSYGCKIVPVGDRKQGSLVVLP